MEIEFSGYPVFRSVAVSDPSQPGEARRAASLLAGELAFDDVKRGEAELVVTELATNIAKHGGGGHLLLSAQKNVQRLDVMAIDKGSGIADVGSALEDGFSSAGTAGNGLGAIKRMADLFEVFTQPKSGTAMLARLANNGHKQAGTLDVGAVSIPVAGEFVCGDAFAHAHTDTRSIFMVVDGLGHGPIAAEAAALALEMFDRYCTDAPAEIIDRMHSAMKATRGAAVAIAEVQIDRGIVTYCGVGNIVGIVAVQGENARNMVSHNGTVGHQASKIAEFTYPWTPTSRLIMHSDGLATHWNLKTYPGLLTKDPALVAAVLYRDHRRTRDDATVVVAGPRAA